MKPGTTIMKGIMRALGALPLPVHYKLGHFVAWLAEKVVRYRVSDVMINLSRSFPDKDYSEIKKIKHQFYRHFGDIVAEAIWFGGCRKPERLRRQKLVEVVNPEVVNHLYEVAPSVMVMYSHAGNWELFGGIASYFPEGMDMKCTEQNFCVVYLQQTSAMWDDILRDNRFAPLLDREHYEGYLESRQLVRYVFSHRGEKKFYNINTDQRPYFSAPDFVKVNFMHQDCITMSAAAALARKFGMAVAFLRMDPDREGHYNMEYVPICEDASKMDVADIMKQYYSLLEQELETTPWNYLWTHRRWAK